jgi:hypothetical protein
LSCHAAPGRRIFASAPFRRRRFRYAISAAIMIFRCRLPLQPAKDADDAAEIIRRRLILHSFSLSRCHFPLTPAALRKRARFDAAVADFRRFSLFSPLFGYAATIAIIFDCHSRFLTPLIDAATPLIAAEAADFRCQRC